MIDSNDLTTLFNSTRRDAQGLLPQLVRRLIFASCADYELTHFEVPVGDDIRLHGWDGKLGFNGEHPYLPSGNSVWEMGVSAHPESKAEDDYAKRTTKPRGVTPSNTAFVFVTPHVWVGREKWIESKRGEGVWADVRVVDGSILAAWLERTPGIALWIAEALGRSIRGLQSLDRYWRSAVVNRYAPTVTPALMIGGRATARDQFVEFLRSSGDVISLIGESTEEAVAFAVAVCSELGSNEQRSRLLILSESVATEHLAALSQDHTVILTEPDLYPTVRSEALDHLRFVVAERRHARARTSPDSIDLGAPARKAVAASLHEMGLSEEEADRIAAESKGSLHAVLWMIAQPDRGSLAWATGRVAAELAPLVLAGQWTANEHPDHEVIAELVRRDYREIRQTLAEWSGPGNPLERRGATWDWKAWEFAWTRLAPALHRDDIDRYLKIAREVLGAADPALELPPEDRWLAPIRGKVHRYSAALREGVAQSLVLLAINGDLVPDIDGQGAAHRFVESLLQVSNPAARWISLGTWLPDLAEAAPDAFLDALEGLTDDPSAVKELFTEGGMFGSSPHTNVLWALEQLAWSPDHLGRVVLALGRLATLDPGGRLANRPSKSLRMIMLPWHPATGATVENRIGALKLLFAHMEQVGWDCAASLLPRSHDIGDPFARPKWREWAKGIKKHVTLRDYWSFQEQLVDLLREHAGSRGDRWRVLLEAAPALCAKHRDLGSTVVEALRNLKPGELDRQDAFALGDAVRALVMRHENMRDAEWSMKGDVLETFCKLRDHLQPALRRDRERWLFARHPEALVHSKLPSSERWERLNSFRAGALYSVLGEEGFDAIFDWATEVEDPESLGRTLAGLELSSEQERRLLRIGFDVVGTVDSRPPYACLAYGYVSAKAHAAGAGWYDDALTMLRKDMGVEATSFFLQALGYGIGIWRLVERQEAEVQSAYWRDVRLHVLDLDECEIAVPKLLVANRPFKVVDLVAMLVHDVEKKEFTPKDHDRLLCLAKTAVDIQTDHLPRDEHVVANSISYEIEMLLSYIESRGVPRQDLARWEWTWLPLIRNGSRNLKALQAELSDSPDLFVELLKWVYRSSQASETEGEASETDRGRGQLAYHLLEAWNRVPGLSPDAQPHGEDALGGGLGPISPAWTGAIDESALLAWVDRATKLAVEADRVEMCYQHIGRQFAYAPAGRNGVWPCIAVCKVIERARNEDLEEGMLVGVTNRRGVHHITGDGEQETTMANKFRQWCEQIRLEHPRTGTVLRRLAEYYERAAKREIEQGRLEEYDR